TASGAGRDADEQPFLGRQAPGMIRRFFVANGYNLVENLAIQYSRYKAGANSLYFVKPRLSSGDHRRRARLHGANSHAIHFRFQDFADTGNRAASAHARDKRIDAFEL